MCNAIAMVARREMEDGKEDVYERSSADREDSVVYGLLTGNTGKWSGLMRLMSPLRVTRH
jgi:hypothetical protein